MKRVVFFINTLSSGGAEHQLVTLADGLVLRGYDVTIATFGDAPDHYKYMPEVKRKQLAPGKSSALKILSIWKYFLTVKTDWIIAFGQRESKFCLMPLLLRPRCKVRVIAGERSTTVDKPSRQERLLLCYLFRRADYIVPNSYAQRRHIVEWKPFYENKTVTITNYTDLSTYSVSPLPAGEVLYLGAFARYNVQKNCLRFVEAMRMLKTRTSQQFVVEWYGNKHLKEEMNPMYLQMQAKVEEYGLTDCIILNDHIKDVAGTMPRYDIICLPSLTEGFSNAISEAICCGKPCLVSDVGDNSVMVQDGVNGFLFDPKDEESIVNAFLKYFALTKEDRQQMAKASRKRAEELFDFDHFIQSYVKLIETY